MSILRNLDRCKISFTEASYPDALQIVVGFICQLCRKASSIFDKIFDELRSCCSAKRHPVETHQLMFTITDHLGEMCKETRSLDEKLHREGHSVRVACHLLTHVILISVASVGRPIYQCRTIAKENGELCERLENRRFQLRTPLLPTTLWRNPSQIFSSFEYRERCRFPNFVSKESPHIHVLIPTYTLVQRKDHF